MDILTLPCSKVSVATGISSQVSYQSKKDPPLAPKMGEASAALSYLSAKCSLSAQATPTPSSLILCYFNTEGLCERYIDVLTPQSQAHKLFF